MPTVWGSEPDSWHRMGVLVSSTREQKTHIYFSFTCSPLKKEVTDGGGGDALKQEMTSIPSATQLTTMIKNGNRERGKRHLNTTAKENRCQPASCSLHSCLSRLIKQVFFFLLNVSYRNIDDTYVWFQWISIVELINKRIIRDVLANQVNVNLITM